MNDTLIRILADKRRHVEQAKSNMSFQQLDTEARQAPAPRGFAKALRTKIEGGDIALITEIKKASPSAGLIRSEFSPAKLAKGYEVGGAACLSVLTDEPYFQGRNQDLIEARTASTLPILRKDFMVDVWQVAEARAIGADCILIIMAAVTDSCAKELHDAAVGYGMDVLIESHDRVEIDRALMLPSGMIGINNRNLRTLKVDLATTEELIALVPPNRLVVSESGIVTPGDIGRIQQCGIHSFLVGESLLRQTDVTAATLELRVG